MNTHTKLSLNQAAKSGKVAKTTLLNALKKGDISGSKTDSGQWEINTSELGRWLDARTKKLPQKVSQNIPIPRSENHEKPSEYSDLKAELEALRKEKIASLENQIEVLQAERDSWQQEARDWKKQAQSLLTDQSPQGETPHRGPEKPTEGFGARLRWLMTGKS